jgi:hypothetical protein
LEYKYPGTFDFKVAMHDYITFLFKGYPEKPSIKLIGDRYRLTGLQRMILYRGVSIYSKSDRRSLRKVHTSKNRVLHIDGYNVLFTIMNYLSGKTLFIGNDGFLRDSGNSYNKIESIEHFYKAIDLMKEFLNKSNALEVIIYLDIPVSDSKLHALEIEKRIKELHIPHSVRLVKSADKELLKVTDGLVATSDSEIIDKALCFLYDLSHEILKEKYTIDVLQINTLMDPNQMP